MRITTTALCLVWVWLAAPVSGEDQVAPSSGGDRSTIVVRYDCGNSTGRREITLFLNGTVRVREGLKPSVVMTLGELGPKERDAFLRRLHEVNLKEAGHMQRGLGGDWVERCALELSLPNEAPFRFDFGRYDSLPLSVSQLVRIVNDLATHVEPIDRAEHLPADYEAKLGDVLRRTDGQLFEVVGETADKHGVELDGVNVPLRLYVLKTSMAQEFNALVSRRGRDGRTPRPGE